METPSIKSAENGIGVASTVSLVIGSMIGAGIFMLPVSLAPLGWNAAIGWLVSSTGALCLAFALARIAKGGNGLQACVERIFGPLAGFVAAWSMWVGASTANGALAIAAASALSRVDPHFGAPSLVMPLAASFVVILTLVNALGIRAAGRMQIVTSLIKVVPLLAVVLLVMLHGFRGEPLQSLAVSSLNVRDVAIAAALTLSALTGFESAMAPVNKIRNPSRTVPIAMIGGTGCVAVLYVLSSTSVLLLLGPGTAASSPAPFADALASEWGTTAVRVAAICIAVSAFGCVNAGLLAAGELAYAMARNGDLPRFLAYTRSDGTPVFSHCFAGTLGVALIVLNANRGTASLFTFIMLLSTAGTLIMYLLGAVGALLKSPDRWGRPFVVIGILTSLFAFYGAGFEANVWGIGLVAIGLVVRAATRFPLRQGRKLAVRVNQSFR